MTEPTLESDTRRRTIAVAKPDETAKPMELDENISEQLRASQRSPIVSEDGNWEPDSAAGLPARTNTFNAALQRSVSKARRYRSDCGSESSHWPHRRRGRDAVDEVRGGVDHASADARRAEAATIAARARRINLRAARGS